MIPSRSMLTIASISTVILLGIVGTTHAQGLVVLRNGSKLNARVSSIQCASHEVVFDLGGLGTATVGWTAITAMSDETFDLNDGAPGDNSSRNVRNLPVSGNSRDLTDRTIADALAARCKSIEGSSSSEKANSNSTVRLSKQSNAAPDSGSYWTGKIEASSALTIGTQKKEELSGRLLLSYKRNPSANGWLKHTTTTLDVESSYGNAKKKDAARFMTTQMSYGSLIHGFIKSQEMIAPFGVLYHNFSQGMRLEQSYGLRYEHRFGSSNRKPDETIGQQLRGNLVIGGDLRYIHEDFGQLAPHFSSAAAGIRVDDSFHLGPPDKMRLIFNQHIEIVPAFKSAKALQARAQSTLSLPLTPRLSLSLQFIDFYVRNAPPGYKQNYSKTSLSFGYVLGKF